MKKRLKRLAVFSLVAVLGFMQLSFVSAQEGVTFTASLNGTPASQSLPDAAQSVDFAKIKVAAAGSDMYLNGLSLATATPGDLGKFTNIWVYDNSSNALIGVYPDQSATPNVVKFSPITIGNGKTKTYLLRGNLATGATGVVRLGFDGFTFATQATPTLVGLPVYGNAMTLPGTVVTPTPTPSVSATPAPSATPTVVSNEITPVAAEEFAGLKDGDIVRAPNNTAVWVIKVVGTKKFKRWMIAPAVLQAYGIPFSRIRLVSQEALNLAASSYLMRRFGDEKIYELWDIEEGKTGSRRWLPTVADFLGMGFDFDSVYTINDREYSLYTEGQPLRAPIE